MPWNHLRATTLIPVPHPRGKGTGTQPRISRHLTTSRMPHPTHRTSTVLITRPRHNPHSPQAIPFTSPSCMHPVSHNPHSSPLPPNLPISIPHLLTWIPGHTSPQVMLRKSPLPWLDDSIACSLIFFFLWTTDPAVVYTESLSRFPRSFAYYFVSCRQSLYPYTSLRSKDGVLSS